MKSLGAFQSSQDIRLTARAARLALRILLVLLLPAALVFSQPAGASGTQSYTYDALGRLVRVDYPSGKVLVYQYDAAGNRTTIYTNGTNSAPTANPDTIVVLQDVALTFDSRVNDFDPDADPLTITAKTNGTHGTVAIAGTADSLTYTPASGYHGSDSFTYTISDGQGHTQTATVTVTVTAP